MQISNKRGQESSNAVTGWLGALIVLIVVALVAWGFFSYLGGVTKLAPEDLTLLSSYCKTSIYSNDPSTYCGSDYKPTKMGSKPAYVTCWDVAQQISPKPNWSNIDCSSYLANSAKAKCLSLNRSGELGDSSNSIYISGSLCVYDSKTGELKWNSVLVGGASSSGTSFIKGDVVTYKSIKYTVSEVDSANNCGIVKFGSNSADNIPDDVVSCNDLARV